MRNWFHLPRIVIIWLAMIVFAVLAWTISPYLNANPTLSRLSMLGAAVVFLVLYRRRRKKQIQQFWAHKRPMKEADFLKTLPIRNNDQSRFCLAVRQKIAREAKVSPDVIRPSIRLSKLVEVGCLEPAVSSGCDILQEQLGLRVDGEFIAKQEIDGKGPFMGARTLTDFLHFYLKHWDRIVSAMSDAT